MTKFVSYLRVSTQRQGHDGLGIEAQRAAVERYVREAGGHLIEEFVEVESGSIRSRPVLVQSIAQCRKNKAVLVIARLDRLARNVAFVSSLLETGVEFVAVDAPFANRLFIHILAAFAEHERTMISERTKAALAAAKARGVRLGVNGQALAKQHKAAAVEFAEGLREALASYLAAGSGTLKMLAENLNRDEFLTREGAKWNPSSVQRVMKRLNLRTPAMAAVDAVEGTHEYSEWRVAAGR